MIPEGCPPLSGQASKNLSLELRLAHRSTTMDSHKLFRLIHLNDRINVLRLEYMHTLIFTHLPFIHHLASQPASHEPLQAGSSGAILSVPIQGVKIQAPQGFISFSVS